ncbi:MAG: TetR/AcrR family transcriptional regulator [Candidatus Omnitrophica bacterium]|nr:TetR/AcrR family transcriptional regulator [Candidatus Omnitrophota bacterium]
MVRTAQAHSPTKERLLDAAERLMLAKGFAATSVEEICEAAKLTKGSFFHYFESKEQLGKAVLERFCKSGARLHAGFCGVEKDPLKRVYNYIDGAVTLSQDPSMGSGCLLGTFSQELCDTSPEIRRACEQGFAAWKQQFGEELEAAKRKYAPKGDWSPKELAEHFIAILEGSLILGKAGQDMQVVGRNLRHFKRYVQQLFGR